MNLVVIYEDTESDTDSDVSVVESDDDKSDTRSKGSWDSTDDSDHVNDRENRNTITSNNDNTDVVEDNNDGNGSDDSAAIDAYENERRAATATTSNNHNNRMSMNSNNDVDTSSDEDDNNQINVKVVSKRAPRVSPNNMAFKSAMKKVELDSEVADITHQQEMILEHNREHEKMIERLAAKKSRRPSVDVNEEEIPDEDHVDLAAAILSDGMNDDDEAESDSDANDKKRTKRKKRRTTVRRVTVRKGKTKNK